MKGFREITVDGNKWRWRVGIRTIVARCGNTRRMIGCGKICGVMPDEYDKGGYHITPQMIADWLRIDTAKRMD